MNVIKLFGIRLNCLNVESIQKRIFAAANQSKSTRSEFLTSSDSYRNNLSLMSPPRRMKILATRKNLEVRRGGGTFQSGLKFLFF
jgi:hypothetical protein